MEKIAVLIRICVVIFIVSYPASGIEIVAFKQVDPNSVSEIINMISARSRDNYERIKTWEGQVSVTKNYIYYGDKAEKVFKEDTERKGEIPKVIEEHRETIIEFSLDAKKEALYANYYSNASTPLKYTDLENGRDLEAKGVLRPRRGVITSEYQIDCMGYMRRDNVVIRRRAVKQARPKNCTKCDSSMHPVYDPRTSLKASKDQIWELFSDLLEIIEKDGKYSVDEYELKVEERKSGDITEYRIIMPSRVGSPESYKYTFSQMVFSSDNGFNISSYKYTLGNIMVRNHTWDYELVDGIYIPIKTIQKDFNWSDGTLRYESIVKFKNKKINKPIPEETFSYKNLGLEDGDMFVDEIVDKEYKYEDANLVFVKNLPASESSKQKNKEEEPNSPPNDG